jgi:hypothetical protein
MIRHDRRMTGRLVLPLQVPAEGDQAGPVPPPLPVRRAPTDWMDQAGLRAAGGVGIAVDR